MAKIERRVGERMSRRERLAVVLAILASIGAHLALFAVVAGIFADLGKQPRRERLMVVRRAPGILPRDVTPPASQPQRTMRATTSVGVREAPAPSPARQARKPSPDATGKVPTPEGEAPPAEEAPAEDESLPEEAPPEGEPPAYGDNVVSVVTDLPAATFTLEGPARYQGSGTLWLRKGAPPGSYTVTFNPATGFGTPPPQTKELVANGQIAFLGRYRRSVEVVVDANRPEATFTLYRPDGRPLGLSRPGRYLLEDLPPGKYTVVFRDLPGHVTPSPQSQTLVPGGKLSFFGEYRTTAAPPPRAVPPDAAAGGAGRGRDGAAIAGRGAAGARKPPPATVASVPPEAGLDRRVQLVVTSYPPTDIERDFGPISYPEVVIRKSNFQQGWCQVYLILKVDDRGDVRDVAVERPGPDQRAQFEALIRAVEEAVRGWDYDKVAAEVHVDVRFYVE